MTSVEFRLPDIGEGIAEAEVVSWLVAQGQSVQRDEPLVLIETDKSQIELPSPVAGTVRRRHAEEGATVPVGEILVTIDARAADAAALDQREPEPPRGDTGSTTSRPEEPEATDVLVRASPYVRKIAAHRGIDLTTVTGSGSDGRVLLDDLTIAPASGTDPARSTGSDSDSDSGPGPRPETRRSAAGDTVIALRGVRQRIAQAMNQTRSIPHITEWREVDATNLLAARALLRQDLPPEDASLTVLPLLLKAVLRALAVQPTMNATYDDEQGLLTVREGVALGIATSTPDGLIVPVIPDAQQLSLLELAGAVEKAAEGARTRSSTPSDLVGSSFTVSNFGALGTEFGLPLIRPPEVGIAGFGRITDRVIAVDGRAQIRPVLTVVAATDHRINDGAELARFVNNVSAAILEPIRLLA